MAARLRPVQAMIAFIDDKRELHGVEPICKVLPIAPSTYRKHVAQRRDPLWTCNGFVPVTYLIMPLWLRTRAG
jgi:hypothetical protein